AIQVSGDKTALAECCAQSDGTFPSVRQHRARAPPAEVSNRRSQQIVESINVNQVESRERRSAEAYHTRVKRCGTIVPPRLEVNGFDAVFLRLPAVRAAPCGLAREALIFEAQVRRKNGHLMPAPRQAPGNGSHLDG